MRSAPTDGRVQYNALHTPLVARERIVSDAYAMRTGRTHLPTSRCRACGAKWQALEDMMMCEGGRRCPISHALSRLPRSVVPFHERLYLFDVPLDLFNERLALRTSVVLPRGQLACSAQSQQRAGGGGEDTRACVCTRQGQASNCLPNMLCSAAHP